MKMPSVASTSCRVVRGRQQERRKTERKKEKKKKKEEEEEEEEERKAEKYCLDLCAFTYGILEWERENNKEDRWQEERDSVTAL